MLLQFQALAIRELCENEEAARAILGVDADALFSILADLRAAKNLSEVPAQLIKFDLRQPTTFSATLVSRRLIMSQNEQTAPLDDEGNLRISEVTRVKILEVRDGE